MKDVLMDLAERMANFAANNTDLKDVREYFGGDLEPMNDGDLRKWFKEWLINEGTYEDAVKWYLRAGGEPNKETLSHITYYAVDLPEFGIHATVEYIHDENTGNDMVDVSHIEFDDEDLKDWNSEIEDLILEVFYHL